MRAEAAFLRFHLRVGARLAMRILAPVLAVIFVLYYILRPEFVIALARGLFIEGSLVESGLVGTLLLMGLARVVAPRITAGRAGWARSLPAGGRSLRALEVLSSVVAEAPLLAVMGALAWVVARPGPERIALRLSGLLIGAAAAGLIYLRGSSSRVFSLIPAAACFFSFSGNGPLLAAAAMLLAVAFGLPADLPRGHKRTRRRHGLPPVFFILGTSLRAAGARILFAYVPAAAVVAAGRLFLTNNELAAKAAFSLSLFSLTLALAVFVGLAANLLAARRPAWPWLRSLPRSAGARAGADALFLGLCALPLTLGLALLGRPATEIVFLVGPLAWFALRGAAAIRVSGDRPFGPMGPVLVEGTILSLGAAVLPGMPWLLAAASPAAFFWARQAERRFKPTLWTERHHLNAGDPLSWGAS